jgi:hypothetical protein
MKRYSTWRDSQGWGSPPVESADGEWVRFIDAEREIAKLRAVVEALPKCHCGKLATHAENEIDPERFCDGCVGKAEWATRMLPYAESLRELEKP